MSSSVAIIDYGMGNLHSIAKALQKVAPDDQIHVTADKKIINASDRVVFPGVGAIRDCMNALKKTELSEVVNEVSHHKPFLGICLGLQALFTVSEENDMTSCLAILPGRVTHFSSLDRNLGKALKIPHMGWNQVNQLDSHPLWKDIPQYSRFYFVHSYYVAADESSDIVIGTAEHPLPFACAVSHENIFAVQFHPEKSQSAGLQLLSNFMQWNGAI